MAVLPHVIRTRRLVLRVPSLDDAETVFKRFARDPEVTRYLGWKTHRSVATTRKVIRGWTADWSGGERSTWVLTTLRSDLPFGVIELRTDEHRAEAGFALARDRWGRGYATEALEAVTDLALSLPDVYRVWAVCDVDNKASARVMERAGFALEGTLRRYCRHPNLGVEPRDVYCYARVR